MTFSDSHCHLDFPALASQNTLITECKTLGVERIVVPSIGPQNWQAVLSCSHINDIKVYPALGIHPWYLDNLNADTLDELAKLVAQHNHQLAAVGEMGIDGTIAIEWAKKHNDESLKQAHLNRQIEFFQGQLNLATHYKLPAIVHHRRSHPEIVAQIKANKFTHGGIIHAFTGSYQQAKQYLDLGFKLGIGGAITYERAKKTRNAIKRLPLDAFVLETDAPAMPLSGQQGQDNTPLNIPLIFESLVDLRDESRELIAVELEKNLTQALNL